MNATFYGRIMNNRSPRLIDKIHDKKLSLSLSLSAHHIVEKFGRSRQNKTIPMSSFVMNIYN